MHFLKNFIQPLSSIFLNLICTIFVEFKSNPFNKIVKKQKHSLILCPKDLFSLILIKTEGMNTSAASTDDELYVIFHKDITEGEISGVISQQF